MTIAEKLADSWNHDYRILLTPDNKTVRFAAEDRAIKIEDGCQQRHEDGVRWAVTNISDPWNRRRYEYPDGSAIVLTPRRWGVEGDCAFYIVGEEVPVEEVPEYDFQQPDEEDEDEV